MSAIPLPNPEPCERELQFCVRDCAVFKFRPADPARAWRPRPTALLLTAGPAGEGLTRLTSGSIGDAVAVQVRSPSAAGPAGPGAVVYFEDPRPPASDMLGHIVLLETGEAELLVRRLLRGSAAGLFDLEAQGVPLRRDERLRWAAHIRAIIPPHQARRILSVGTSHRRPRCPSRSGQEES